MSHPLLGEQITSKQKSTLDARGETCVFFALPVPSTPPASEAADHLRNGARRSRSTAGTDGVHGWIHVRIAMKGPALTAPMREPKTKRTRSVPVPPDLAEWLAAHPVGIRPEMPLFRNSDPQARDPERHWSYAAMDKRWTRACNRVGVRVGMYEGTKHSMVTQSVSRGVDVRLIQEFLGHANIRSTGRYAQVRPEILLGVRHRSATGLERRN
jgi:integrase